jgi:hypothetical protein
MILPAFAIPQSILEKIPQARQWAEKVKQHNYISIGVVGEAVRVLPGILDSIEVSDALLTDNVKQQGQSGDIKVISGWADCDLTVNLILLDIPKLEGNRAVPDITRHDCLREIAGWFKKMKDGAPQIYTVHHPHVSAWGTQEFVFNSLKSSESRNRGIITCSLEFDEHDSVTGKSQERQIAVNIGEQAEAEAPQTPPVSDHTRAGLGKLQDAYAKR